MNSVLLYRVFVFFSAIPTAEGAIEIAIREMPITLYKANCVVTGFGRIAKVLTKLLVAFGANVCVAARKHSDLTWAEICGAKSVEVRKMDSVLKDADVIFNTVPAMIIDKKTLGNINKDCLLIDLASKPGGIDFDTANELALKSIWALSLPGKVAPKTSGAIIKSTVDNILSEIKEEE